MLGVSFLINYNFRNQIFRKFNNAMTVVFQVQEEIRHNSNLFSIVMLIYLQKLFHLEYMQRNTKVES